MREWAEAGSPPRQDGDDRSEAVLLATGLPLSRRTPAAPRATGHLCALVSALGRHQSDGDGCLRPRAETRQPKSKNKTNKQCNHSQLPVASGAPLAGRTRRRSPPHPPSSFSSSSVLTTVLIISGHVVIHRRCPSPPSRRPAPSSVVSCSRRKDALSWMVNCPNRLPSRPGRRRTKLEPPPLGLSEPSPARPRHGYFVVAALCQHDGARRRTESADGKKKEKEKKGRWQKNQENKNFNVPSCSPP